MSAFRASSPGADLRDYLHRMPPARNPELAAAYECGQAETKAARIRGPLSVGEHLARHVRRFKPRRRSRRIALRHGSAVLQRCCAARCRPWSAPATRQPRSPPLR